MESQKKNAKKICSSKKSDYLCENFKFNKAVKNGKYIDTQTR